MYVLYSALVQQGKQAQTLSIATVKLAASSINQSIRVALVAELLQG